MGTAYKDDFAINKNKKSIVTVITPPAWFKNYLISHTLSLVKP